ncbi:hypothetical protein Tco_1171587 [Tanacetum coccineum]
MLIYEVTLPDTLFCCGPIWGCYNDDDNKEEKKDEKEGDEMGSLETRTEKMQTPIPTTLRSPRINLSSDKNIAQELTDTVSLSTPTTSKDPHKQRRISSKYSHLPVHPTTTTSTETTSSADLQQQLYLKMKSSLQDQANDLALWDVLKRSLSKQSDKDSTTYVSKQQQQQEWDAWEEETVIDEDEVIPKD